MDLHAQMSPKCTCSIRKGVFIRFSLKTSETDLILHSRCKAISAIWYTALLILTITISTLYYCNLPQLLITCSTKVTSGSKSNRTRLVCNLSIRNDNKNIITCHAYYTRRTVYGSHYSRK